MPAAASTRYFDLGAIQPLLEAGGTVLTPNLRLARRIKTEWDRQQIEKGLQTWSPVAVYSLDNWLAQRWQMMVTQGLLPSRPVLTALQQGELWRQVIEADSSAHDDYNLLRLDGAAELAMQARDMLLRAGVALTSASVVSEFGLDADCATFLRWLRAFEERLAEQDQLTPADCVVQLTQVPSPARSGAIALVDFDDIAPLHWKAIELHGESVCDIASGGQEAELRALSFPDRRAELSAVAAWAAAHYARDPACRLGILLADMNSDRAELEYQLRRAFGCLGENYTALPVDFSTGITLDRAPVVRDALRMLAVAERSMGMVDVLGLIQTRFATAIEGGNARTVKLLQQLYADGSEQVAVARLRQLAGSVRVADEQGLPLGDVLQAVSSQRLQGKRCLPSDWVEPVCQLLQIFGWPGHGPLDSLEYQQVESWYAVLESFAGFDAISGRIDYSSALALLRKCCQSSVSQPQTAASGIQVLGTLEGAGLQFEQVWLCGLQASRWPAPARPNPFIPMALQQRFAMPHCNAEREWQYASTLMNQYRAGCATLNASYARQVDGVPELPSPLLAAIQVDYQDSSPGINPDWLHMQESARLEWVGDTQAPPVAVSAREELRGGSGILQAQANCPFRAFASRRLSLEPLEPFRSGLSAAQRGSLLHEALYVLWGELVDSETLKSMDEATLGRHVSAAVASAVKSIPAAVRQVLGMHCIDLEERRLAQLLLQWLDVERARDPFTVIAREQAGEVRLGGLALSLRVDRVDELADGSRVVIDYKSGRSALSSWLGERPAQPQLPLYGLSTEATAVAFAQVRARDCRMLGLGEVSGIPGVQADIGKAISRYSAEEDWQGLRSEWERNLTRLAEEFLAGDIRVDPLPAACTYCGIQPLCRIELTDGESV